MVTTGSIIHNIDRFVLESNMEMFKVSVCNIILSTVIFIIFLVNFKAVIWRYDQNNKIWLYEIPAAIAKAHAIILKFSMGILEATR